MRKVISLGWLCVAIVAFLGVLGEMSGDIRFSLLFSDFAFGMMLTLVGEATATI